jgi:hypothetical protein
MKTANDITSTLSHFTGSCEFYRWSPLFKNCLLTEGTQYLAESAAAYWLMDAVASHQTSAKLRREDFQVWNLNKIGSTFGAAWVLSCDDGNDNVLAKQLIEYSDFPLQSVRLFVCRNDLGGVTIMLPSEY